jgi:hypothetical protein
MTINPAFKNGAAAAIQPIKANFRDAVLSTQLGVGSANDDLHSSCILQWKLMDDDANVYDSGAVALAGEDYQNWNGDNAYPFTYIGNLFNLTFL